MGPGRFRFRAMVALVVAMLALGGCGDDDESEPDASPPTSEPEATDDPFEGTELNAPPEGKPSSPDEDADAYAFELAGKRTGCTQSAPGEGGDNPGCIYSAAYAGCYEAITGDQLGPVPFNQEFPEPELRAIYKQALADC